jgi:pantoate--beta-alanine ligase
MEVFNRIKEQNSYSTAKREGGKTIGFVPTMGALHQGHISLVEKAVKENNIVIASIFVNPIQFNNPEDLAKYPRNISVDLAMLEKAGVNAVFVPSEEEMYPEPVNETYNFGHLESVMEGKFRPGHFNGVAIAVRRLFDIVKPHRAYFGEKDFQQLLIIKALVKVNKIPVDIISCPISREEDGLARSSRNARLSIEMRKAAPFIYQQLAEAKAQSTNATVSQIEESITNKFKRHPFLKLEYFKIADAETLEPVTGPIQKHHHAFIAVFAGDIRLIDNISFI